MLATVRELDLFLKSCSHRGEEWFEDGRYLGGFDGPGADDSTVYG